MNATLRGTAVLTALALAGCAATRTAQPPAGGAAAVGTMSPAQLLAVVQQDADGIDRSTDPAQRTQLLAAATASARQCLAQAPDSGACQYAQAQARGVGIPAAQATFRKAQQAVRDWVGDPSEQAAVVAADRARWQQQVEQALHDLQ